jgi:hypothetical protein
VGARSSRAPRSDLEHREVRERDPVQGGAAWLAAERLIERRYSAGTVSRVRAYPSQGIKPKETHKMIKSGSVLGIGVALVLAVSTSALPKVAAAAVVLEVRAERELARRPAQAQAVEANGPDEPR